MKFKIYKVAVVLFLALSSSCFERGIRQSQEFLVIDNYSTGTLKVDRIDTFDMQVKVINDSTLGILQHYNEGAFRYDEDIPIGNVLIFSPYTLVSAKASSKYAGLFFLLDTIPANVNNLKTEDIYVFACIVDDPDAVPMSLYFYNASYGFIAVYSVEWDRIMIQKGLESSFYSFFLEVYEKLQNDPSYYALPKP